MSEPREILTPNAWQCVGIVRDWKKFRLVFSGSQVAISWGDLRAVKLDEETKCAGLTQKQAMETGERLDGVFALVTRRIASKIAKG